MPPAGSFHFPLNKKVGGYRNLLFDIRPQTISSIGLISFLYSIFLPYLLFSSAVLLRSSDISLISLPAASPWSVILSRHIINWKFVCWQVPVFRSLIHFRVRSFPLSHLPLEMELNLTVRWSVPPSFIFCRFSLSYSNLSFFYVLSIVYGLHFVNTFFKFLLFYLYIMHLM